MLSAAPPHRDDAGRFRQSLTAGRKWPTSSRSATGRRHSRSLTETGASLSLADFAGRKLVLTSSHGRHPGCTRQACSLRDTNGNRRPGAAILGYPARGWNPLPPPARSFNSRFRCWRIPTGPSPGPTVLPGVGSAAWCAAYSASSERVTFLIDEAGKIAESSPPRTARPWAGGLETIDALPDQQDRRV